jgi:DNA-binding NarL/FixJ family response regulator
MTPQTNFALQDNGITQPAGAGNSPAASWAPIDRPEQRLRVVIADDHLLMAQGLARQLTGMEVTRKLRASVPHCKIILISMHAQSEFVREAFAVGASGYLVKSSGGAELRDAIREVMRGNVYVSSSLAKDVLACLLAPPAALTLTPREREILALIAQGCSAKEIGGRLHIAVKTAQFHRTNIMTKLGVHSTAEMTRYAMGHGIVSC